MSVELVMFLVRRDVTIKEESRQMRATKLGAVVPVVTSTIEACLLRLLVTLQTRNVNLKDGEKSHLDSQVPTMPSPFYFRATDCNQVLRLHKTELLTFLVTSN